MSARRIVKYSDAFRTIGVRYDGKAKSVVAMLEKEGHTEKSICFSMWKGHTQLSETNNAPNFWGIFVNTVRQWSWPKDDPRWETYWKKKIELKNAQEQQEQIQRERAAKSYKTPYSDNLTGFIYFIQGENGGPIKIGYTTNIAKRLKSLQTGYPDILKLLLAFPGNMEYEAALHKQFAKYRLSGEWFKADPVILNKIKDLEILNKRIVLKKEHGKQDGYMNNYVSYI